MDFRYSGEHEQLRQSVRRFLASVSSDDDVRRAMDTPQGYDETVLERLAGELGLLGLAVPEVYGGAGFGLVELGLVLQEAGRALLCAPLLSSSLATRALLASGDAAACASHLPALVEATSTATLAVLETGRAWDDAPRSRAVRAPEGWALIGDKDWVLDGGTAALLVVSATTAAGTSLFLVDTRACSPVVEPLDAVDPTRRASRVCFTGTPAVLLGVEGGAAEVLARVRDEGLVLLGAEQLGVAERCLDTATAYAKEREQFGRPIGSFQAIKHKLADVLLEVEAARSAVMYGTWAADHRPEELPLVAAVVGTTCTEAALRAAGENIQVHGGMGATWEHPAHLLLKRAVLDGELLGGPQSHHERLAGLIGLDAEPEVAVPVPAPAAAPLAPALP